MIPNLVREDRMPLNFKGYPFYVGISLDRFSLERQKVSGNGMLFLFDRRSRIIAHTRENPIIAVPEKR
ncbi:hypothetical protein DSCA_15260 [Desulfosarcina alkanivorans]|jgi:hypothetical protein|uniref:Uncharacterized protein n=2 Tax=Desulfosarcina alkanivorans TaxID=571177 RepID=A0A5K7YEZ6_9BACT|nr:hypothetical protein DSCA_15260 [Desulfosarcina alkanivorans]